MSSILTQSSGFVAFDSPDPVFAIGMLGLSIGAYWVLRSFWPGYGNLPREFSDTLNWLQGNASGNRVLAWWDYAAPLRDHTTCKPLLVGPSRQIKELVDDPSAVDEWTENKSIAEVAAFFLSPSLDAATEHVHADEFDYLLVARSDVLKVAAMVEALDDDEIEVDDADDILLRKLLRGTAEWPIAFENEQVKLYRSPSVANAAAGTNMSTRSTNTNHTDHDGGTRHGWGINDG